MGTLCFWATYPRKEKTTKPEEKLVRELTEVVTMASLEQTPGARWSAALPGRGSPSCCPAGGTGPPAATSGLGLQAHPYRDQLP